MPLGFRGAQPEGVAKVYGVAVREAIRLEPTREPNGIFLLNPPRLRVHVPVTAEDQTRPIFFGIDQRPVPRRDGVCGGLERIRKGGRAPSHGQTPCRSREALFGPSVPERPVVGLAPPVPVGGRGRRRPYSGSIAVRPIPRI